MLADAGILMIVVQWPLIICALIPVVIVEALLIRRWVRLSYRDAFIGVTKANLLSTLAGVPLAWLVMFVLEMAVVVTADGAQRVLEIGDGGSSALPPLLDVASFYSKIVALMARGPQP